MTKRRVKTPRDNAGGEPFYKMQKRMNDAYYRKLDPLESTSPDRLKFHTPSQGKRYAQINAMEFIEAARNKEGSLRIDEWGAADGTFAKFFLDYLREEAPAVYGRTTYCAWDKYPSLRPALRETLSTHQNTFMGDSDAANIHFGQIPAGSSDWIFCHELFDDLATHIVSSREGKLSELWFITQRMGHMEFQMNDWTLLPRSTRNYLDIVEFMKSQPENIRVSIPMEAIGALRDMAQILKQGGQLRIFDYGYTAPELIAYFAVAQVNSIGRGDIFKAGYSMVGSSQSQVVGSSMSSGGALGEMQITTAVNFPFLKIIAEKAGLQSCIETMLSWASRVSGERQTTPSHYVQGLAYGYAMDQQPVETSHYEIIKFLVSTHSIFTDPNLKTKIKESIEECGETEEALKRVLSYLPKFPETLVASREELGKPGFVAHTLETSLAHFILESGIFSQLASQTISISNQELVQIVPDKTQRGFRISLKPIVDELEDAGFERNSVETVLFAPDPTDSKSITGSTARVCFSATKQ